ncbi:MAG TPA: response regulator [Gemmatimonadaceae bacterium]|nr:response regulator [Gemmatimonadaceae bacterium]
MTEPREESNPLRVVVADDERPARSFLAGLLRSFEGVEVVGEAANGAECVELIEAVAPDLALLDLQMPEVDGLGVVRLLRRDRMPLIAFVTAYDEYAVRAFELNAVDYLLKPVDPVRLRRTINRAIERLERAELRPDDADRVRAAATAYAASTPAPLLRRIPVRKREDIFLIAVDQVASVVADGELLHITTRANERYTISYRLKDLEARLDPAQFVRLSRGTLVNVTQIQRISPLSSGTFTVVLHSGAQHQVSRLRGRVLRDQLMRL